MKNRNTSTCQRKPYGYTCDQCHKFYKNKYAYEDHVKVCGKAPTVPCVFGEQGCQRMFAMKSRATMHGKTECVFRPRKSAINKGWETFVVTTDEILKSTQIPAECEITTLSDNLDEQGKQLFLEIFGEDFSNEDAEKSETLSLCAVEGLATPTVDERLDSDGDVDFSNLMNLEVMQATLTNGMESASY
jgi:hypothetical protein